MLRALRTALFGLLLTGPVALGAQDAEMEKVAARLAAKIAPLPGASVAVVDFTDLQGRVTELGRFYAEELSIALANAPGGFKVIDRGHLKALLAEHKFQTSGVVDEKTAAELGRIAGVTILVTGTVADIEGSLRLAVKALNTQSAAIQAAVSVSMLKSDATSALLRRDVAQSVPGQGSQSGSVASRQPAGAPNVRMFQNDFLIVGVDSISLSRKRTGMGTPAALLSLALSMENKGQKDRFLAHKSSTLMDTSNRKWQVLQVTGLSRDWQNYPETRYTRISPGERKVVVIQLRAVLEETEISSPMDASSGNLVMELCDHLRTGNNRQEFSVGLSGLPLNFVK